MQTEPEWFMLSVVVRSQHRDIKLAQNIFESFYTFKNTDCNLPNLKQINKDINKQTKKGSNSLAMQIHRTHFKHLSQAQYLVI